MTLALVACSSDVTRFGQPALGPGASGEYTGSITPRTGVGYGGAPPPGQNAPGYPAGQGNVQQAPLAAPGSYPSQPYPGPAYPAQRGAAAQTPYPAPAAPAASYPGGGYGATGAPRTTASQAPTPAGGTVVRVEPGETLYSISRRYGIPVNALMNANAITDPTQVQAGQRLSIPTYSGTQARWVAGPQPAAVRTPAQAPTPRPVAVAPQPVDPAPRVTNTPGRAPSPAPAGGSHVVASGETLYSISRRYGVSVSALMQANRIAAPEQLRFGQRLTIPGRSQGQIAAANPPVPAPAPAPTPAAAPAPVIAEVNPTPAPMPQGPAAPQPAVVAQPQPAQPAQPAAVPEPQALQEGFRWPVRGRVISAFGEKTNGTTNDGIKIAVPEGTSVRAAENGVVIYAGNELQGFGNLVLVRHAQGWVTAYAHNRDLKVKRGDKVTRGQIIAAAGKTGNVSSPQLHFELRQGSKPVDPLRHLTAL